MFFFSRARKRPERVRRDAAQAGRGAACRRLRRRARFLAQPTIPGTSALCLVPDGDLFAAIKRGHGRGRHRPDRAVHRDRAARWPPGEELQADIVVTATGLVVQLLGGIALDVDGAPVNVAERFSYKGMMLSDVPNLASSFGYTNASWTLKCDLTARYVCRLLRHMDRQRLRGSACRASARPGRAPADARFQLGLCPPRRGQPAERRGRTRRGGVHQNYLKDLAAMRFGPVADGAMEFRKAG